MFDFMPLVGGHHGEALVLLLAALALDFLLGFLPGTARAVPVGGVAFAAITTFLEGRLNRAGRASADLMIRGTVVVLILLALAIAVGMAVFVVGRDVPYGWILGFVVLAVCLSSRRVFRDLRRGLRFAASDNLGEGRRLVGELTGRDASRLDKHGLARVIVETGALGVMRRAVVPSFWFVLLGFPGLLASRAVSRLVQTIANRSREDRAFGTAARALDHTFGLFASLLAGYLLSFAALFVPMARPGRAFATMSLDARRDIVVNDGRIKGAAAGALGLALGGPFGTKGGGLYDTWIGNGSARVGQGDIRRSYYLCAVAVLLNLLLVAALVLVRL